jgi:RNA polymerase sigma-70 factor (ECF subfamily)
VARPRATDALDIEAVYRDHHDFVWRSLRRLGVPTEQVDDAVQEVFLAAARRLADFEQRSALSTWLFAIALRVAHRLRRTEHRHRRRVEALGASVPVAASEPHRRTEAADTLHRLLDLLDDEKRIVFVLVELEGFTAPEIADMLGVKLPTVYTRLRAARLRLEQALAEEEGAS